MKDKQNKQPPLPMDNVQVDVKQHDTSTEFLVKIPLNLIQQEVERIIRDYAKNKKIDGFRKGKVPVSFVRTQFGPSIQHQVVNRYIQESAFFAIESKNVRAVSPPSIDTAEIKDGFLVYQSRVESLGDIEIQGLDSLEVERQVASVSDEDVDLMINNLQKQRQTFEPKDGGALEDGDQAVFDFVGSIDGEKFEGGSATNHALVIGSNAMIDGFESGMIGMKAGETRTIEVKFPENYQAKHLAGKTANFEITLHDIKAPRLPELDDEFLRAFGIEDGGVEKLRADVKKNMEREINRAMRTQINGAVFDALLEKNQLTLPKHLINKEIESHRNQMVAQFGNQFGGQIDKNLLPDELFEAQAMRSLRLGVLMSVLIEKSNIKLDQARVKSIIEDIAQSYEDPEEMIAHLNNDKRERANVEAVALENQVVDFLLEKAKVSEKTVKYQDLLASSQRYNG